MQLSAQVQMGQAHTERVRRQAVSMGHTADARHAEASKAQAETAAQIENLSMMVKRVLYIESACSATWM